MLYFPEFSDPAGSRVERGDRGDSGGGHGWHQGGRPDGPQLLLPGGEGHAAAHVVCEPFSLSENECCI